MQDAGTFPIRLSNCECGRKDGIKFYLRDGYEGIMLIWEEVAL